MHRADRNLAMQSLGERRLHLATVAVDVQAQQRQHCRTQQHEHRRSHERRTSSRKEHECCNRFPSDCLSKERASAFLLPGHAKRTQKTFEATTRHSTPR
jgi:hypothetical protein